MRLIDADKLLADNGLGNECNDCKQNTYECENNFPYSLMSFCVMVDLAPTVDAVPVVRCKDCKWRGTAGCVVYGEEQVWDMDNEFCSYGERK